MENTMKRAKQVLVVRKDLKMRVGKVGSQTAHASLGAILSLTRKFGIFRFFFVRKNTALKDWIDGKFTKICVYVNSEQELIDLYKQAKKAKLLSCLITDAGDTEFHGIPTKTVLAIGPAYAEEVDAITGKLPLL